MQINKTRVKAVMLLVLFASLLLVWLVVELYQFKNKALNVSGGNQVLVVAPGASLKRIANQLVETGLIERAEYFVFWGRWLDYSQRIHIGEYAIKQGMTPIDLLEVLVQGQVLQHSLTIVEGWNFKELLQALWAHEKIKVTLKKLDYSQIMTALGYEGEHPEGRFYPDTYHFPTATSDADFLKRAYQAMQQRLAQEWASRAEGLPLKTPYEALILASIIEKETGVPEERATISGVFVRRLQKNMRLQTDPTVIYGMGEAYDGNIRRRDLRRDTPYNTYTRKGLPPTPIAMPGGDAIHAALHPLAGSSLYFVSRGDGSHVFSDTLAAHEQAVDKYQRKRK